MKVKFESVNVEPSAEHHFYAWCVIGWATSDTALGAVERLVEAFKWDFPDGDGDFWVIKVALPESATYNISHFEPVVDKALKEYVIEAKFDESDILLEALRT